MLSASWQYLRIPSRNSRLSEYCIYGAYLTVILHWCGKSISSKSFHSEGDIWKRNNGILKGRIIEKNDILDTSANLPKQVIDNSISIKRVNVRDKYYGAHLIDLSVRLQWIIYTFFDSLWVGPIAFWSWSEIFWFRSSDRGSWKSGLSLITSIQFTQYKHKIKNIWIRTLKSQASLGVLGMVYRSG